MAWYFVKVNIQWNCQVLFKLVIITVLVIAESADNCIKSVIHLHSFIELSHAPNITYFHFFLTCIILQIMCNCKVSHILPLIADTAKNDRSAVLRARYSYFSIIFIWTSIVLQAIHAYLLLWQVLRICTLNIGVLGRCSRNTLLSWFVWRPNKVLCCRCNEWGIEVGITPSKFPDLVHINVQSWDPE